MKHTLITIGWTGIKSAYLDLALDEAKARYAKEQGGTVEEVDWDNEPIDTFEFEDEFRAYDVWAKP